MNEDLLKLLKYLKYVAVSIDNNIDKSNIISTIIQKTLQKSENTIKVLELGTGVGAISIPFSILLQRAFTKNINWTGIEKDGNAIKLFFSLLDKIQQDSQFWQDKIIGKRNLSDQDYANTIYSLIQPYNTSVNSSRLQNINYTIYQSDLEKIVFNGVEQELENVFKEKFHILFVPFIFQHLTHWRRIFSYFEKYLIEGGILVSGVLGKDWNIMFNDYLIGECMDESFGTYWAEIWQKESSAATSYRDYRGCNIYIFEHWLKNIGYQKNTCELIEEFEFTITKKDMDAWIKNKLWSPFLQFKKSPKIDEGISYLPNFSDQKEFKFKSCHRFLFWEKPKEDKGSLDNKIKQTTGPSLENEIDVIYSIPTGHVYDNYDNNFALLRAGIRVLAGMPELFEKGKFDYGTLVMTTHNEDFPWYGPCLFINPIKYFRDRNFNDKIYKYLLFLLLRIFLRERTEKDKYSFDLTTFVCKMLIPDTKVPFIIVADASKLNCKNSTLPKLKIRLDNFNPLLPFRTIIFEFEDNKDDDKRETFQNIEQNKKEIIKKILEKVKIDEILKQDSYLVVLYGALLDLYRENNIRTQINNLWELFSSLIDQNRDNITQLVDIEPRIEKNLLKNAVYQGDEYIQYMKAGIYNAFYQILNSLEFTYFIGFPIFLSKSEGHSAQGLLWFSYSENEKPENDFLVDFYRYTKLIFTPIATSVALVELENAKKEIKKHALRSAVAAIMARNMSHNIGSHVLANITNDLDSLQVKLKDSESFMHKLKSSIYAEFNEYIQTRMDFIARITSGWPSWTFPFDFYLMLVRPFKFNYGLLNNIAKSEGLTIDDFEIICKINCIEVSDCITPVCNKSDLHPNSIISFYHKLKRIPEIERIFCTKCKNELKENLKYTPVYVDIPEANIGAQAFYSILENFIRNSAKHGHRKCLNNEKFKIFIELKEETDCCKIKIYDNVSIIENPADSNNLVKIMEDKIKKELIDGSGQIDPHDWGSKEMKISAAYLNLAKIEDAEAKPLDTIKPVSVTLNSRNYLGYEFNLRKPKYLMIVDSKEHECKPLDNKLGIDICPSLDEIIRKKIRHKFLLVVPRNGEEEKVLKSIQGNLEKLPFRIIIFSKNTIELGSLKNRICVVSKLDNYEKQNDWIELFYEVYEEWIKFLDNNTNDQKYRIVLYLGEDANNETVKRWQSWSKEIDNFFILNTFARGDSLNLSQNCRDILFLRHGGKGLNSKDSEL
ncbi:MAG: hypothetical protein ABIL40_06540, partial [candidate division WOR-3 bacterium]